MSNKNKINKDENKKKSYSNVSQNKNQENDSNHESQNTQKTHAKDEAKQKDDINTKRITNEQKTATRDVKSRRKRSKNFHLNPPLSDFENSKESEHNESNTRESNLDASHTNESNTQESRTENPKNEVSKTRESNTHGLDPENSSDEEDFLRRKNERNGGRLDYTVIEKSQKIENTIENEDTQKKSPYLDEYHDESCCSISHETEPSEDIEKKFPRHKRLFFLLVRIFDFAFTYFVIAAFLVTCSAFLFDKQSEWPFFYESGKNGNDIIYSHHNINLRLMIYFVAFITLLIGILSSLLSGFIYTTETYFGVTKEYLTICSSITTQISLSITFLFLLVVLLYKKMSNYQFAMDTTLDFGHVVNTLLFATVIFTLKSYILKKISLSFDYTRYIRRIKGILIDHYVLTFLKGLKKFTTQNSKVQATKSNVDLHDGSEQESITMVSVSNNERNEQTTHSSYSENRIGEEGTERARPVKSKKKKNAPHQSENKTPFGTQATILGEHKIGEKGECGLFREHPICRSTGFNRKYIASFNSNFKNKSHFRILFDKKISEYTKEDQAYLFRELKKLRSSDPSRNRTRFKWQNKSFTVAQIVHSLHRVEQLEEYFCCKDGLVLWLKRLRIQNLLTGNMHNRHVEDFNIDSNHRVSNLESDDLVNASSTLGQSVRMNPNRVSPTDFILSTSLSENLIYKLYERRDSELYFLNMTIEQNNAAVERVSNFLTLVIFLIVLSIFLGISLNKTDKTIDIISALFGTGFILNSTIKDAISSTVFVFCIKPYDVGNRIFVKLDDKTVENLLVTELNVLSTTFIKFDGLYVVVPNIALSSKSISNVRRSTILSESFYLSVSHDTPVEDLELLKYNISLFLRSNTNLFTEFFMFNYHTVENCNKLTLRVFIQYVENWQQYDRYLERRGLFLSFLNDALLQLGIKYKPLVQPVTVLPGSAD